MNAPSPPINEQAGLARPNASPTPKPKPKPRPKRPLSAYNLFYRFKRQKIVEAVAAAGGAAIDNGAVRGVIAAPPGLEGVPASATDGTPSDAVLALRRQRIMKDLEGNTDPRDSTARSHRTNKDALNGAMSFVDLGKAMNSSWKVCDSFAKSVFDELSQAGRQRYRQRMADYNARAKDQDQCEEEPAEAKATLAPAPDNKDKFTIRRLPMKKYIAAKVKWSPSPSLNGDASATDDASAMNETADAMVRLASGIIPSTAKCVSPTNGNETEYFSTKTENCAEAPSGLSSSPVVAPAASNVMPQDIPNPLCVPPSHVAEELLVRRVKRLEAQLAEERMRVRFHELEADRSRRLLAREALARSAQDSFLLNNGLPVHSGHSPTSVQQQARAAVLSRLAELQYLQMMPELPFKRPSPMMPGSALPHGIDFNGPPVKKLRLDPHFAARRGWGF